MNPPDVPNDVETSNAPTRWQFLPARTDESAELVRRLGITPLAARLLAARDYVDPKSVQGFLKPLLGSLHDPFLMRDMDRAIERIARALTDREPIAIYGDYDVDGLTATALIVRFFDWLGVKTVPYIPHRLNDGYGMSHKGIDHLAGQNIRLIVTVDNGINCNEEIAYAASRGIDVVVTDHHQPGEELPPAVAVVNPNRADCPYPFKELSGVGVAFKLAHALAKHLKKTADTTRPFLRSLMDLVALGTIADIVPLLNENRVLVSHGLLQLSSTDKIGLQAMIRKLGIGGKPITGEAVGFMIGPRLNAAGRTEDARYSLDLLLSVDAEESRSLAEFLDQLNQQRRRLEMEVYQEALGMIATDDTLLGEPVLVVAGEGWHQGILGIVASRLVERFNRPAIVLGIENGQAKGSARSIGSLDLYQALHSCEMLLSNFGGHKMAAGLTLPSENIAGFRKVIGRVAADIAVAGELAPEITIDATAGIDELTFEALSQIDQMRPYGEGNPSPTVALLNCCLVEPAQIKKEKHLKLRIAQDNQNGSKSSRAIGGIFFGAGSRYNSIVAAGKRFDVAGTPVVNEWNGNRAIEINIKEIRPSVE